MPPRPTLRLTAPEDALAALRALLPGPVAPCRLPVDQALGLVLAGDLRAACPVPARPLARRDGWAVEAAATLGAGPYAPAPLPAPPAPVAAGEPLPPGADAVLRDFDLEAAGPLAAALRPAAPGEGVLQPGEAIAAGTLIRAAGQRLGPRDLPALAALGLAEVAVRRPRLGWIATGAEIVAEPARDTLRPLLAALAAGALLSPLPSCPDDPDAIAAALREAAPRHDLLLLAGGSGEGASDRSAEGLALAGRVALHGIGMRPGMTAGLGQVAATPVLLLPGLAEDALAAWLLLGRPALATLAGAAPPTRMRARLAAKLASAVGLLDWVPVQLDAEGRAHPLAIGALPAGALAAADAVLAIPPGAEGHEAGAEVALDPIWTARCP